MIWDCCIQFDAARIVGLSDIHHHIPAGGAAFEPRIQQLRLVLGGRQTVRTRFGATLCQVGDVMHFLVGEPVELVDTSDAFSTLSLFFSPAPGDTYAPRHIASSPGILRFPASLPSSPDGMIQQLIYELHAVNLRERDAATGRAHTQETRWLQETLLRRLWLALAELDRRRSQPSIETRPLHILRLLQFITRHPETRRSAAQFAEQAGISEQTLRRHFKNATGMTLKQYLLRARVNRARQLVGSSPHVSFASIADQCGFSDEFHFSKVFKRELGVTPANYRRERALSKPPGASL